MSLSRLGSNDSLDSARFEQAHSGETPPSSPSSSRRLPLASGDGDRAEGVDNTGLPAASALTVAAPPSAQHKPPTVADLQQQIQKLEAERNTYWVTWGRQRPAEIDREIATLRGQISGLQQVRAVELGADDPQMQQLLAQKKILEDNIQAIITGLQLAPVAGKVPTNQELAHVLGNDAALKIDALNEAQAKLAAVNEQLSNLKTEIQGHLDALKPKYEKLEQQWQTQTGGQEIAAANQNLYANFTQTDTVTDGALKLLGELSADSSTKDELIKKNAKRALELQNKLLPGLGNFAGREQYLNSLDEQISALETINASLNNPTLATEITRLTERRRILTEVQGTSEDYIKYRNIRKNYQELKSALANIELRIVDTRKQSKSLARQAQVVTIQGLTAKTRELVAQKKRLEIERNEILNIRTQPDGTLGIQEESANEEKFGFKFKVPETPESRAARLAQIAKDIGPVETKGQEKQLFAEKRILEEMNRDPQDTEKIASLQRAYQKAFGTNFNRPADISKALQDVNTKLGTLNIQIDATDKLYRHEMSTLQKFDIQNPHFELAPEGWGSWLYNGIKQALGIAAFSPRDDGRNRVQDLAMEKLMANEGLTLAGCYAQLKKSSGELKKWVAWQAKLIELAVGLPAWADANPQAAQDMYTHLLHAKAIIDNSHVAVANTGLAGSVDNMLKMIRARSFAQDILGEGDHGTEDKGMPAEIFALLHIASLMPYTAHVANDDNTRLGIILHSVGLGTVGQIMGDATTAAVKTAMEQQVGSWLPPHATTDILEVIGDVIDEKDFKEIAHAYATKQALRIARTEIRALKEQGPAEYAKNIATLKQFRDTWKHANNTERLYRVASEFALPAAAATMGLTLASGPAAIGIAIATILLSSFVMGRVNDRFITPLIWPATQQKVRAEQEAKRLEESLLGNKQYNSYLKQASARTGISETSLAQGAAEQIAQIVERRRKSITSDDDFGTEMQTIEKDITDNAKDQKVTKKDGTTITITAEQQRALQDLVLDGECIAATSSPEQLEHLDKLRSPLSKKVENEEKQSAAKQARDFTLQFGLPVAAGTAMAAGSIPLIMSVLHLPGLGLIPMALAATLSGTATAGITRGIVALGQWAAQQFNQPQSSSSNQPPSLAGTAKAATFRLPLR